jgi:hypothetical protein
VKEPGPRQFELNAMLLSPSRRWLYHTRGIGALLTSAAILTCWHFGIWSVRDWNVYQAMNRECHPVWKDLYVGTVYGGQTVEEVIARTEPSRLERFENFVLLEYCKDPRPGLHFTGVTIIAQDGRLIDAQAFSCTWQHTFFKSWNEAEREDFWRRYWAHKAALQRAMPVV